MSGNAASGAGLLVLGQIGTKLATFAMNQLLVRYISPVVVGLAAYMEFLVSTSLFFSREAARLAAQRTPSEGTNILQTHQQIINFGYLSLLLCLPVTGIFFAWQFELPELLQAWKFPLVVTSVALVVLELGAEPLYLLNQYQLNFKKRTTYESLATFARCTTVFVLAATYSKNDDGRAIFAFSFGQLIFSVVLLGAYQFDYWFSSEEALKSCSLVIKKPNVEPNSTYFNEQVFAIWKSIFVQMIFKEFLSEGDHLLINYFCSLEEQGVYAIITNYGSLVARLFFQPIEESLRLYCTKLLTEKNEKRTNLNNSKKLLSYLTVFYVNFCVLCVLGGYPNASFLLKILLGSSSTKWENTGLFQIFPTYVLYIPFLAFNGIFELFFSSVATQQDISRHSIFMTILSVVFFVALFLFIDLYQLGVSGLIFANMANMTLRIGYCVVFIQGFFTTNLKTSKSFDLSGVTGSLSLGIMIGALQYQYLGRTFEVVTTNEFLASVGFCLTFLVGVLIIERDLIKMAVANFRK